MDGGRSARRISRWMLEHDYHPPLTASDDARHAHQFNFYLCIVLVIFMAISVVALVCCCYHLEWRLRLQARRASRSAGVLGQNAGSHDEMKVPKQETNLSVMMPGDSIPSFLAKVKPHGSVTGTHLPELPAVRAKDAPQPLR